MLVKSKSAVDAVTIKGAGSELDHVDAVEVIVDVSTMTESTTGQYSYSLMLADGIDREDLYTINMGDNLVTINNTVYTEKEIPIKLRAKSESAFTLSEKDTKLDPKTVKVGIPEGIEIDYAEILLDENAGEGDYKIEKREGVYIPDSRKTVHIKPVWEKVN